MQFRFLSLIFLSALLLAAVACGDNAPTPTASPAADGARTATPGTTEVPAPSPTSAPTADRSPTVAPETREVLAPVEDVTVHKVDSEPVAYFLIINSGLPNSCHTFDRTEVEQSGREITVSVINRKLTGDIVCAEIYRTEAHPVYLGADFEPDTTYAVRVNDWETSFTTEPVTVEVEAPIEDVAVDVVASDPVRYFLEIEVGVPDTCHKFDRTEVERSGREITVSVINRVVADGTDCAAIERVAPHTVPLGSDFEPDVIYTVRVNDREISFTGKAISMEEVGAPIENLTVHVLESDPVQYFLEIRAGLPNTCHTFDRIDVERLGPEITVTVINLVATGDVVCAEVYRSAPHVVALGTDFEAGVTYTVGVNDWETSLTTEAATLEVEVEAPIDDVRLLVLESDPPQYFLDIMSGLPDACHTFDRVETQRSGTEITVTVINRVATGDVACAQVYETATQLGGTRHRLRAGGDVHRALGGGARVDRVHGPVTPSPTPARPFDAPARPLLGCAILSFRGAGRR